MLINAHEKLERTSLETEGRTLKYAISAFQ